MKRFFVMVYLFCIMNISVFAQVANNKTVILEINNVVENGGTVYVSIYANEQSYKNRKPDLTFEFQPCSTVISHEVTIPFGEYAITMYQDANNNGQIDLGLFGIPKELFGLSNYFGRGFPSNNFNKLKIPVNGLTEKITVGLYRI